MSRKDAVDKLDDIFSKYIRKRDCRDGDGRCISCGIAITEKDCDAGHYINRQHESTRWYLPNVNAQCRECNRKKRGNLRGYERGLIQKYGSDILNQLKERKRREVHPSEKDLEQLTEFFKEQLKRL